MDGIQIYKILNSSKQTKVAWPDFTPAPSFIIYSAHRNNTRTRPWRLRPDRNAFIFYSARTGLATQPRPNSYGGMALSRGSVRRQRHLNVYLKLEFCSDGSTVERLKSGRSCIRAQSSPFAALNMDTRFKV